MNTNKEPHIFTATLVDNGNYLQYIRDGRRYAPRAKLTSVGEYSSEDKARACGQEEFENRDELDHIVVIERDADFNFIGGSF